MAGKTGLPPAPPEAKSSGAPEHPADAELKLVEGAQKGWERIGIYGEGGCGKTTLASLVSSCGLKPLFLDLESGSRKLQVARYYIDSWQQLLGTLRSKKLLKNHDVIVIDSLTKAEEYCEAWMLNNVPLQKGNYPKSIEDYGWGKGYPMLYDYFTLLFQEINLLTHPDTGTHHVICTAHDCAEKVPNPAGEDFLQWQPRLQNSSKGNIRARFKEEMDHLLFLRNSTDVSGGKAVAEAGLVRVITAQAVPHAWAASRSLGQEYGFANPGDYTVWKELFGGK